MGSGSSKPEGGMQVPDHVARVGFPHSLHFTWARSWSKMVLLVSTHKGTQPLYAASMPGGFPGSTVFFAGGNIEAPPMGYVERKHNKFTIQLPGVPTYGLKPSQAAMKCENPHTTTRYEFTMPIGNNKKQKFESFEWRRTNGKEVKSLGLSGSGWKLVRTAPGKHSGSSSGKGLGYASDGKEVVAVFAHVKTMTMSVTDCGGFQFLGSGATPEMGYHWALMAVLSAITLMQHQLAKENDQTGSGAVANAAVTAATA